MVWGDIILSNPEILNISPALEGRMPVDGKDYILISYANWEGFDKVYVHVDPDTFLPCIFTYIKSDIKTQVIYSDYREADGLKSLTTMRIRLDNLATENYILLERHCARLSRGGRV